MADPEAHPDTIARPWLEVRLSDYRHEDRFERYRLGYALVIRVRDKGLRLRLILDEARDITSLGLDPVLPQSYGVLSDEVYLRAEETIIHLKDGRIIRLPSPVETNAV